MRELARRDRTRWQGLTRDQRLAEAAAAAMKDVQAAAARREYNATLQVLRTAETDERVRAAMALNDLTRSQGFIRDMDLTSQNADAIRNEATGHLGDLIDAAESKAGTGPLRNLGMRMFDLDNPRMTADIVREVFRNADGSTGNAAAKAGARAWLDVIEGLRVRFNAAGGDIGKLGYGYLTQAHDAVRVFEAGAVRWADTVLPLLDRNQYVRTDGALMTPAEVRQLLTAAHETLSTGGANKRELGAFAGTGARANRGMDHRVLHFRDGDAWMAYMREFGQGSLYDAMLGHIANMARGIALVERMGPNPQQQFRVQNDLAQRADGVGTFKNRAAGNTPQDNWNVVSGVSGMPENRLIAQVGQDARNVQTAAKLGGAVLSAFTDVATIAADVHFNKLPYFAMLANIGRQFDGQTREFLRAHGVMAENLTSTLNRWTGDNLTHSLTGRVAGAVMKLSLMNAWTDGLRSAFAQTMMGGLARMARKDWAKLSPWDRYLLERKGITDADWQIISKAVPDRHKGGDYLTADGVRATGIDGAEQAATKVLAFVIDEAQFAVVNPDVATRAIVTGGGMPRGTIKGEAMRSFAQFKSFPIAMMTRHWRRIMETPQGLEGAPLLFSGFLGDTGTKFAAFAALNVSMMMLGAIVLQNKALVQFKDPYDMTEGKFWMRALAQGGGMGYLGDLIFKDPTENRGSTAEQVVGTVLGPVAGSVAGVAGDLVVTNAWQAAKGKETDLGAEALRWGNSQLPGQSVWWARGLWETWFLHSAQEALNPGYLARMKARAQRDWGQKRWWETGEPLPERMPDFERITGE